MRILVAAAALLGPFILYGLYWRLSRRPSDDPWPLATLFFVGALLAAETFLLAAVERPRILGRFEPAHLENGLVEPGRPLPEPQP